MDVKKIGLNIASLRKKKGLTQQELGDKLFVTDKAVSKWERGICLPDVSILEKLADVLDTDIYELLQIKNKKNIKLEKILEEERIKIKKQLYKKIIGILIVIILVIVIGLFAKNNIRKPNELLNINTNNEDKVLKECVFTKTFRVEDILQSNDEDYLLLTIREFNCEEVETIRVKKSLSEDEFVEGNNYEFTLKRIKEIKEDNVNEIFDKTEILAIKETDKIGLDQVQENPTCE